ncbi:hypothetical protein ACFFLM_21310 [Deinococcus oregonensis]|uniref:Uncharacterized protein n=1 Tax=Deinococcus oregonensis TaxID=1805970 RepID=A0ABV6B413_9DEIO
MRDAAKNTETAGIGTARTLAYQYGMPPAVGTDRLAPRSMTSLPLLFEGEVEAGRVTLDVGKDHGRFVFSGYVANIGDVELKAAWMGVDGGSSGFFSLPPAATVQIPCILRGILLESRDGAAARYQVSCS